MLTKRLFLKLLFIGLLLNQLYAQNTPEIDSLYALLEGQSSKQEQIDIYNELAWEYRYINTDSAYVYATQALELAKEERYKKGEGDSYNRLGIIYRNQGEMEQALRAFNEGLKIRTALKDFYGMASTYTNIGEIYRRKGEIATALTQFYNSAAVVAVRDTNHVKLAEAYKRIALSFQDLGDYDSAMEHYRKSLRIYEFLDDELGLAHVYLDLGTLSEQLKLFDKAKLYAAESLKLYKKLGDKQGIATAYNNLGNLALTDTPNTIAIDYYEKALTEHQQISDTIGIGNAYLNIGIAHEEAANYEEALRFYETGLNLFQTISDSLNIAASYHHLANVYHKKKEWKIAESYYKQALETIPSKEGYLIDIIYYNLSSFYEEQGAYKKAHHYANLYIKMMEDNLDNDKIVSSELTEIESASEILALEGRVQAEKLQQHRLANYLLFGLLIFSVIGAFLLFWGLSQRYKTREAHHKTREAHQKIDELIREQEITALGNRLEGEEKERQRIAADLHDRIGSLLATVKIFFNELHREKEDVKVKEVNNLLNDTIDEVRRVSHNLAAGIVEKLGLVPSLQALADKLNKANQIKMNVMPFGITQRLPLQMEMKLYRILNELTSNTLKHAKAEELNIQLLQQDKTLYITVEDDGIGFNPQKTDDFGLGLRNIDALIRQLEGNLNIDSNPKSGTTINMDIKLEK